MTRLSIALIHYPVVDRYNELYTTAITNLDVHDIARSACTYGLNRYYVVNPISAQQCLAETIANFWVLGSGKDRNIDRSRAMELVAVKDCLESCIKSEQEIIGERPLLIATSAKPSPEKTTSFEKGQELISNAKSTILLFGTGHGLASSVLDQADYLLAPLYGPTDYNHLSVRSAAAIILDRLRGR